MPLYDIRCQSSGEVFERFIKLEKFEEVIICACGAAASRVISSPLFTVDNTDYTCPVTGRWIGSKKEHENNLRQHDCRVLESGEKEAARARREAANNELDKKIEETVEREIEGYSSAKKEQLHNELINGKVDLAVERR